MNEQKYTVGVGRDYSIFSARISSACWAWSLPPAAPLPDRLLDLRFHAARSSASPMLAFFIFLLLPGLSSSLGLLLIPIGIFLRRRKLSGRRRDFRRIYPKLI